jgi:hypothetical protein
MKTPAQVQPPVAKTQPVGFKVNGTLVGFPPVLLRCLCRIGQHIVWFCHVFDDPQFKRTSQPVRPIRRKIQTVWVDCLWSNSNNKCDRFVAQNGS